MIRYLFYCFSLIFWLIDIVCAQNLVPDPTFEVRYSNVNGCWAIDTGITSANITSYYKSPKALIHWSSPTYVPSALFDSLCGTVPKGGYGYQLPYKGRAYAGIDIYQTASNGPTTSNLRSYVQTKLIHPLDIGKFYKISFYVSPTVYAPSGNPSKDMDFYATKNIGAHLSDTRVVNFSTNPSQLHNENLTNTPQVINDTNRFMDDTTKWYRICGIYKAAGGEEWLTIGNFEVDSNTQLKLIVPHTDPGPFIKWSLYFVSYVTVEEVKNINPQDASNDTVVCPGYSFSKTLSARPGASDYLWSTGDTTESITVDTAGIYWLNSDYGCGLESDTFKIREYPKLDLELGNDIAKCAEVDSVEIAAAAGFSSYLWSTGDTTSSIKVNKTGLYSLKAISACDTLHDSVMVNFHPIPPAPLVNDTGFCIGDSIGFSHFGQNLKWYEGKNDILALPKPPALRALGIGEHIYYVSQTINGCESEKSSFKISVDQTPFLDLGADTILCGESEYSISVPDNGWNYRWNNGESTSSIVVDKSDNYILTAENYCGVAKDSIQVDFQAVPTPPKVENNKFCNSWALKMDSLKVQGVDLKWYSSMNDSIASPFPDISNPIREDTLRFIVSQTIHSCESEKTGFYVEIIEEVGLNWPEDTTLCEGGILILGDSAKAEYLWSTNERTPFIEIVEPGFYSVSAKNYCGTVKNSIWVYFEQCSTLVDVPNIFTPNNDGIYDYFGPFGKNFKLLEIVIFNKWGNKIYNSNMHWDGRYQGNQVPEGQYYYIIKILDKNNELVIKKGMISLVR